MKLNGNTVDLVTNKLPEGYDLIILRASLIRHSEEMEMHARIGDELKTPLSVIGTLASEWPHLFGLIAGTIIIGDVETALATVKSLDDLPGSVTNPRPL